MANHDEQPASQVVPKPTEARKKQSGAFKHLLTEHREVFALARRLGMRSDREASGEPLSAEPREIADLSAALREILETEGPASDGHADPSDLADALAALETINPGSPEWGPTFLQVSDLVEAHVEADETEPPHDQQPVRVAC
ncbi:MAG TPA: hypothetical protein VGJ91_01105 [Polyangiaceae bacterium]|jgi:hypothetical protein